MRGLVRFFFWYIGMVMKNLNSSKKSTLSDIGLYIAPPTKAPPPNWNKPLKVMPLF